MPGTAIGPRLLGCSGASTRSRLITAQFRSRPLMVSPPRVIGFLVLGQAGGIYGREGLLPHHMNFFHRSKCLPVVNLTVDGKASSWRLPRASSSNEIPDEARPENMVQLSTGKGYCQALRWVAGAVHRLSDCLGKCDRDQQATDSYAWGGSQI